MDIRTDMRAYKWVWTSVLIFVRTGALPGLCTNVSHGRVYSYGLYSYGLDSYGLYSYGGSDGHIWHNYLGHNCTGHNYIGHNYTYVTTM